MIHFEKIVKEFKTRLAQYQNLEFEIFCLREESSEIEVKESELHIDQFSNNVGAAIRLICQKKLGFAYTTDFSSNGISSAIEKALSLSELTNPNNYLQLSQSQNNESNSLMNNYDKNYKELSKKILIQSALELERAAIDFDPKVKRVRGAGCEAGFYEVYLVNSWGVEKYHQKTMNTLSLMAVAENENEAEMAHEFDFSCFFENLNPEKVGKKAAKKALSYLGAKPGPTIQCPVLLDALTASEILEVLAPSFYADHLLRKRSLFCHQQNKQVLSSELTLIDDGWLQDGAGSFPFDGEGVAKQRTVVVEQGVFKQPLFDLEYAAQFKVKSTGSSVREGIKRPSQISHSNFFIEKGELSFEQLVQSIQRGIYITELIGIHTADPISGDFSVGAQGFLIEKGEITTPIKQIALSGNLKEVMNRVEKIGSDLRFCFKIGSPSLLISSMDLAGV